MKTIRNLQLTANFFNGDFWGEQMNCNIPIGELNKERC